MKTPSEKRRLVAKLLRGYIKDPSTRGTTPGGGCLYLSTDGKRCAVGEYLRGKVNDDLLLLHNSLGVGLLTTELPLDSPATKELQENIAFFKSIQNMHDEASYFKYGGGLTEDGKHRYRFMINEINTGTI